MSWHLGILHDGHFLYPEDITDKEMDSFIKSRTILIFQLSANEMIDVILNNYEEFCGEIYKIGNGRIIRTGMGYSKASEYRTIMNRSILNLLSSCRAYLDFNEKNYAKFFGKNSVEFKAFKQATSDAYDSSSEYRICYRLRNYILHHGFPITSISFGSKLIDLKMRESSMHFNPQMNREELLEEVNVWNEITLSDLRRYEEKIDVFPLMSKFTSDILKIHKTLIPLTEGIINNLEAMCNHWMDMARTAIKSDKVWPVLVNGTITEQLEDGVDFKQEWIPTEAISRLKELKRSNITHGELHKVTNLSTATAHVLSLLERGTSSMPKPK